VLVIVFVYNNNRASNPKQTFSQSADHVGVRALLALARRAEKTFFGARTSL
jgi:hypothetical protein